jgi:hypothetical protein
MILRVFDARLHVKERLRWLAHGAPLCCSRERGLCLSGVGDQGRGPTIEKGTLLQRFGCRGRKVISLRRLLGSKK